MPIVLGEWPEMITILREPVSRSLSHINHIQRDPKHALHNEAKGLSVQEFLENRKLRRCTENFQARQLASLAASVALVNFDNCKSPLFGENASIARENFLYSMDTKVDLLEAAIRALELLRFVGITDQMEETLSCLKRIYALENRSTNIKVNTKEFGCRTLDELSTGDFEALSNQVGIDQSVYLRALELFQSGVRALN